MKTALLDVNVLVALWWPAHEFHDLAQDWFSAGGSRDWATCLLTQAAFVRLVCNPAFSRDAASPQEAVALLEANLEHAGHHFWPDSMRYPDAARSLIRQVTGHQQVNDAYLLGLAIHHRGKLVTLDRGIASLLPPKSPHRSCLEMIPTRL